MSSLQSIKIVRVEGKKCIGRQTRRSKNIMVDKSEGQKKLTNNKVNMLTNKKVDKHEGREK
jgi:hypothetical protein